MKLLTLLLFLIIHASSIFGQSAEEYMEIAEQKILEEDYPYALNVIEKAIELDSVELEYRIMRGGILMSMGRTDDAEDELYRTIAIDSTKSKAYNSLACVYMNTGRVDEALDYFSKAIQFAESDSLATRYYVNRATTKGMYRDFEGATKDLENAYQKDSTDTFVLNNLSIIYRETGKIDAAIVMLKKTIEIDSTFLESYGNLGLIYSENNALELSEYYFKKGLEIAPKDPLLLNNSGYLYYKKGDFAKALEFINASINIYPENSYAYRNRALVYFELDLKDEACRDLEIATHYGFKVLYGDEVEKLYKKKCKKRR